MTIGDKHINKRVRLFVYQTMCLQTKEISSGDEINAVYGEMSFAVYTFLPR